LLQRKLNNADNENTLALDSDSNEYSEISDAEDNKQGQEDKMSHQHGISDGGASNWGHP
jgi:hypothetical protein